MKSRGNGAKLGRFSAVGTARSLCAELFRIKARGGQHNRTMGPETHPRGMRSPVQTQTTADPDPHPAEKKLRRGLLRTNPQVDHPPGPLSNPTMARKSCNLSGTLTKDPQYLPASPSDHKASFGSAPWRLATMQRPRIWRERSCSLEAWTRRGLGFRV